MRTRTAFCLLLNIALLTGCPRTLQKGPLIAGYESADCIPVRFAPRVTPPTRSWDDLITLSSGQIVHISGTAFPGGWIDVRYQSDGAAFVAVNPWDYMAPVDVRIDHAKNSLFLKESGVPASPFSRPQTWLFEFDLIHRKQIARAKIDPAVLPHECRTE